MALIARAPRGAFVLIGFMGAGKSSAARELAVALGVGAADSDELLEQRFGRTVAEQFQAEADFRAREEELVCELLDRAQPGEVISLGGGSVLSERVRDALARHLVVLLDVDAEQAWRRVSEQDGGSTRPLARDRQQFFALHARRRELYERLADAQLPAQRRGVAADASQALTVLAAAPQGTRLLWACSASGSYPVLVGGGLLEREGIGLLERAAQLQRPRSRSFCVTDEHVAPLYARRLGGLDATFALPAGESHKTLVSAQAVWQALVRARLTRADHLVALGGGVVGDVAGFCAATFQRGMPVLQVPTTVVAQVDSAYGGKTGVDLPQAKNYVGAYHQPAGVLVDPRVLATLAPVELAAGWVEVLKTALIAGGQLWARVQRDDQLDDRMILDCVRLKLAVVAADERDRGLRRVLNLGHTVGHAIEAASAYSRYRHGEAVGLGLLAALRLSGAEQLRARVRELLAARGLPVVLEHASAEDVLAAVALDKKRVGERLPFVLLHAPGDFDIEGEVGAAELRAAVQELAP